MKKEHDEYFMRRALLRAEKAHPRPNPKVGAVIVKGSTVVAEGFHTTYGGPHAEVIALRKAGRRARGATLYVTLEPCAHTGKTPPCIDAILAAGIASVVIAMKDPNPLTNGKSIKRLQKSRIPTTVGVCQEEAMRLNESFIDFMKTGEPFVTIKTAMSLDGKIATVTGDSKGLSGPEEQQFVQSLRADHQAIAVGINTILIDDPRLTCRIKGSRDPLRIVLDSMLRTPLSARVLRDPNVLIATSNKAPQLKQRALEKKGARVVRCGTDEVSLRKLLKLLAKEGIQSLLVEGGSEINAAFIEHQLAHKIIVPIAPKIIGGKDAPSLIGGMGVKKIKNACPVHSIQVERIGQDVVLFGYLK